MLKKKGFLRTLILMICGLLLMNGAGITALAGEPSAYTKGSDLSGLSFYADDGTLTLMSDLPGSVVILMIGHDYCFNCQKTIAKAKALVQNDSSVTAVFLQDNASSGWEDFTAQYGDYVIMSDYNTRRNSSLAFSFYPQDTHSRTTPLVAVLDQNRKLIDCYEGLDNERLESAVTGTTGKEIQKPSMISIVPEQITIRVGESYQLEYEVVPSNAQVSGDYFWYAMNENVATVDDNGIVTGLSKGVTDIMLIFFDCDCSYRDCVVNVVEQQTQPPSPDKPEKGAEMRQNNSGEYCYYVDGVFQGEKTGFISWSGSMFLLTNGKVDESKDGLEGDWDHVDQNGVPAWYYLANGQVVDYTGLAEYDGEWFYVESGRLDTTKAGFVDYNGGKFFVAAGQIARKQNFLTQDPNTKAWYYLAKGQVVDVTTLAEYDGEWFYIIKGKLAEDYTGKVIYNGAEFSVVNGMVR